MNKLLPMLAPTGRLDPRLFISANRSTYTIRFRNGNVWQFHSAENYEGMRGATLTHLICDEYAYFREGVRTKVLAPMLAVKGQKAIYCSTPCGKNDFWRLSQYCLDRNPGWVEFVGDYAMTGNHALQTFADAQRPLLPDDVYRQEYEAAFIDGGGAVFRHIDRLFSLDEMAAPGKRHYAGIDLGQMHDRTVVVVFNEKGQMVHFKRFELSEQMDSEPMITQLADTLSRYPHTEAFVETNFNRSVLDALRTRFRLTHTYGFQTNNANKQDAIGKLIDTIDHAIISAPRIEVLRRELENYQVSFTPTQSRIRYGAPTGLHDDCVMALALANRLLVNKTKLGVVSGRTGAMA